MVPTPDRRQLLILFVVLSIGCGGKIIRPKKDGPAAEKALLFCELLLAGKWSAAQALTLSPTKMSPQMFEQKSKALVKRWNLENAVAHISSVGERRDSTVVHLSLFGKRQGKQHRVTVSVVLVAEGEGWKVLPPT